MKSRHWNRKQKCRKRRLRKQGAQEAETQDVETRETIEAPVPSAPAPQPQTRSKTSQPEEIPLGNPEELEHLDQGRRKMGAGRAVEQVSETLS